MRFVFQFLVFIFISFSLTLKSQEIWDADNENGTYTNPILYSYYSDPDVVKVGDMYYMTASSFNSIPGLPILESSDLVNWKLINYARKRNVPEEVYREVQHGKGVWAPCNRFYKGEFYIFYPDPDFGILFDKNKNSRRPLVGTDSH